MSSKAAPSADNTTVNTAASFKVLHNGHPLTHVGQVVNASLPRVDIDPRGGQPTTFDVWYCQKDHVVFLDNAS